MPENSPVQIAFCLDKGYLYPTQIALYSLLETNHYPILLHVFGYDLSKDNWAKIHNIVSDFSNVVFHKYDISSKTTPLPGHGLHYISSASYLRLLLPQYLSGRVTYLDGDILVRHDISEFATCKLGENEIIAAVPDASASRFDLRQTYIKKYPTRSKKCQNQLAKEATILNAMLENTGHNDPQKYFNAGIFTIDFDKLKAQPDLYERYQSVEGAVKIGFGSDQRYLNSIFHSHVRIMDFRWNSQMRNAKPIDKAIPSDQLSNWHEARKDPAIIHFVSRRKPWFPLSKCYSFSARKRLFQYRMVMRKFNRIYG